MNRRSFLKSLGAAAAAFSILPAASTYARAAWRPLRSSGIWVINPEWKDAPYEWGFCTLDGLAVGRIHESMLPARFRALPANEKNLVHPYIPLEELKHRLQHALE